MNSLIRFVTADIDFCRIGCGAKLRHHICGQIHKHRTRFAGASYIESFLNALSQHLSISYHYNKLCHIPGNSHDVYFLKGIIADKVFRHLSGETDQGNTIIIGCGYSCYQVRCSRAAGDETDADLSCRSRITVCRMNQPLLMSWKHQINTMTIMECI